MLLSAGAAPPQSGVCPGGGGSLHPGGLRHRRGVSLPARPALDLGLHPGVNPEHRPLQMWRCGSQLRVSLCVQVRPGRRVSGRRRSVHAAAAEGRIRSGEGKTLTKPSGTRTI